MLSRDQPHRADRLRAYLARKLASIAVRWLMFRRSADVAIIEAPGSGYNFGKDRYLNRFDRQRRIKVVATVETDQSRPAWCE